MKKKTSAEKSFSAIATDTETATHPHATPSLPVYMLKRIGTTTYKVAVHFNPDAEETAADKIARLIRNDVAVHS